MEVNASATLGVGQDLALDTTNLPADHAPKFLAEAKRTYKDSKPPFVTGSHGKITEGSKRPVFIAKNGKRPALPIRAVLVAKNWGPLANDGIYWTLDLNGERLIVQSFTNKGCVSGAKWIYCCWSGVGEEFEELPVAFSCINGDYSNALGPRTKSTAVARRTGNSLGHDHPRNITPLPKDIPVEYLGEAKALYANSRPPFVIHKTKESHRRVHLATQDGHFSATSTEAEVVYRAWDSVDDYATMDLDGKRFIVVGNAGGFPGGYRYHLWLGSKAGRVDKVVAYRSQLQRADASKTASALTEQSSEVDKDPSSSSSSDDEEDQDPQAGATDNQQYFYNDFKKAFDPTVVPPVTPSKFSTRQPILSSDPSARNERPSRRLKPTKRARSPSPPAHFGSKKSKAPAQVAKRTRHASDDSSDISSPLYGTPAPTPSTNDRPAPTPETQTPQTQVPTSLPTLTLYKQTHTTLRATRDSNVIGFVPLRLLTCMTMSTLFSSVIAASGHREDEEPIQCLMAIFDWKDDTDVYKTMYIDKGTEGSYEIFLEIIDEAPCWKNEGGKCGIAVEVVRA